VTAEIKHRFITTHNKPLQSTVDKKFKKAFIYTFAAECKTKSAV